MRTTPRLLIKGLLFICFELLGVWLYGQKPIIDADLTGLSWPSVGGGTLSPDGRYAAYTIMGVPAGSSTVVIRELKGGWQKEVVGVGDVHMTSDSRWAVFLDGNSLWLQSLGREERMVIREVTSYQLLSNGEEQQLVYMLRTLTGELVVRALPSGKEAHYRDVKSYRVDRQGGGLLLERVSRVDSGRGGRLSWVDLLTGQERAVWEGEQSYGYVFAKVGSRLAFIAAVKEGDISREELWYYRAGMEKAVRLVYDGGPGIDTGLTVQGEKRLVFSRDGERLFFYLTRREKVHPPATGVQIDIWHYKDWPLQSEQLKAPDPAPLYLAVVPVGGGRVIQLQREGERIFFQQNGIPGDMAVVSVLTDSLAWQREARSYSLYAVSAIDGSRRLMGEQLPCQSFEHEFRFSPGGHWILWFNRCRKMWYSYDWKQGINRPVSKGIPHPIYNENSCEFAEHYPYSFMLEVGVGGWLKGDRQVLLYDDYDIWKVDLAGVVAPVCVTKGYGRQHGVKLRIAWDNDHRANDEGLRMLGEGDSLLLSGLNRSMENGFFGMRLSGMHPPTLLCMVPAILYAENSQLDHFPYQGALSLQKAVEASVWLLLRQSELEAPNYCITEDFKSFQVLSDIQPQRSYNWLTAELLHWKTLSGQEGKGILYKPEDFNPKKKYPVLFNYYEQLSSGLHHYPAPTLCLGSIDVAYFVSRGYLVCIPDIHYRIGHPGEGVVDAVVSAAQYLSRRPYVDSLHMGIQGHSFGGFETNYLVTHTQLFAAAAESAGAADLISFYGGLSFGLNGYGKSLHEYYEVSQGRMGVTLWERLDLYRENTAVLRADMVTTPLLMVHNKGDALVPFMHGVEFFTALRRLGKQAWMLQYDGESHAILQENNSRDYSRRLLQFFDHFLKEAPAPVWMVEGIPARNKSRRSGYELDGSGRRP